MSRKGKRSAINRPGIQEDIGRCDGWVSRKEYKCDQVRLEESIYAGSQQLMILMPF